VSSVEDWRVKRMDYIISVPLTSPVTVAFIEKEVSTFQLEVGGNSLAEVLPEFPQKIIDNKKRSTKKVEKV
jgi:hypothetical protein